MSPSVIRRWLSKPYSVHPRLAKSLTNEAWQMVQTKICSPDCIAIYRRMWSQLYRASALPSQLKKIFGKHIANLCDIDNSLFAGHIIHFCSENNFKISSCAHLPERSYTYVSERWNTTSWLDHVIARSIFCMMSAMKIIYRSKCI